MVAAPTTQFIHCSQKCKVWSRWLASHMLFTRPPYRRTRAQLSPESQPEMFRFYIGSSFPDTGYLRQIFGDREYQSKVLRLSIRMFVFPTFY